MNRLLLSLALLGSLGTLVACKTIPVTTTLEPGADLSVYRTFAQSKAAWLHPIVGDAVGAQIDESMQAKGYTLANADAADMVISYRATGERKSKRVNAGDPDVDFYVIRQYIEGTVAINVFDGESKTLVWQGVSQIDLGSEKDAPDAAREAVQAILAEFPAETAE